MCSANLKYLMNLPKFAYFEPETIEEACQLLSEYKDDARLIAGGTDLIVSMKERKISPQYLINLKTIPALNYICCNKVGVLELGATATLSDIENSQVVREKHPLVALAAKKTGPPTIRNVATMAGNFCSALPSADAAPLLICLGAKVKIQGTNDARIMPLEDFFIDSQKNALKDDEILTEIQVPPLPANSFGAYIKNTERSATDIAVVSAAAVITMDAANANVVDAKIVLGAVAPTPLRAIEAENIIKGKAINDDFDDIIEEAALAAAMEAKPRTRSDYKRDLVRVLTSRALKQAIAATIG